jgi:hypothetical protein
MSKHVLQTVSEAALNSQDRTNTVSVMAGRACSTCNKCFDGRWCDDTKRRHARGCDTTTRLDISESELLNDLEDYYRGINQIPPPDGPAGSDPGHQLKLVQSCTRNSHERLFWFGKKEFDEAVQAYAKAFKDGLERDPKLQICLTALSGVGSIIDGVRIEDLATQMNFKSGAYVLDEIMSRFSDDEIRHFGERLQIGFKNSDRVKYNSQIILVDDWCITGIQAKNTVAKQLRDLRVPHDRLTMMTLAVADPKHHGEITNAECGLSPINRYSYWTTDACDRPILAGQHSVNDISFGMSIDHDVQRIGDCEIPEPTLPLAVKIAQPYKQPDWRPENILRWQEVMASHVSA